MLAQVISQPTDMLLSLGTTIRSRLNLTISQAFEKFKTSADQMSYEAFIQMISFFLGFEP